MLSRVKSVLVTGGAGFIGSHLVERLLERGHRVRVLDSFATGRRESLDHLPDVEIVEGDVQSYERVANASRGCQVVFHEAALPSVPRSVQDPLMTNVVNVTGTLNVLLAARDNGASRVVYASSSSVYGANAALPKAESMPPAPISPYAVSKLAGEHYCRAFSAVFGVQTVALRYFNVFGPRQDPRSQYAAVIPRFITAVLAGEPPLIFGDGEQSRDFTYVENVIDANLLAMEADGVDGMTMNVACGERVTLNQLVAELGRLTGREATPRFVEPRPGDVRHSHADITLARTHLGFDPAVSLAEGLARTLAHFDRTTADVAVERPQLRAAEPARRSSAA
jgi:UDP-glucose 4-epimerase